MILIYIDCKLIKTIHYLYIFILIAISINGMGGMSGMQSYLHKKKLLFGSLLCIYLIVLLLYGFWYKEEFRQHFYFNLVDRNAVKKLWTKN